MQKFIASLLPLSALAASGEYVYNTNGAEWGESFDLCKTGVEQSPINLTTGLESTGSQDMELIGYNYYDFGIEAGDGESVSRTIAFTGA